jgi:hypothetical protein
MKLRFSSVHFDLAVDMESLIEDHISRTPDIEMTTAGGHAFMQFLCGWRHQVTRAAGDLRIVREVPLRRCIDRIAELRRLMAISIRAGCLVAIPDWVSSLFLGNGSEGNRRRVVGDVRVNPRADS